MSEELIAILQTFGISGVGIVAMWLYHKATIERDKSHAAQIDRLVELLAQLQTNNERTLRIAEDTQFRDKLTLKLMEVVARERERTPQGDDTQSPTRHSAGKAAHPARPE